MSYEPSFAGQDPARAARDRANTPGIVLLIVGLLNLIIGGVILLNGVAFSNISGEELREVERELEKAKQDMPPDQRAQFESMIGKTAEEAVARFSTWFLAGGGVIAVCALLTVVGAICMMRLRGHGWAVLGAIAAAVPLASPLACPFVVGLGVGIWALVVLFDSQVRQGFSARPSAQAGEEPQDWR